jgi:hypothetical protein
MKLEYEVFGAAAPAVHPRGTMISFSTVDFKRGLLRVWIAASIAWVAFVVLAWNLESHDFHSSCSSIDGTQAFAHCPGWPIDQSMVAASVAQGAALALVPPTAVYGLALVLVWVGRGFKPRV